MSEITVTVTTSPIIVTVDNETHTAVATAPEPSTIIVQGLGLQGPSGPAGDPTGDIDLGTFN